MSGSFLRENAFSTDSALETVVGNTTQHRLWITCGRAQRHAPARHRHIEREREVAADLMAARWGRGGERRLAHPIIAVLCICLGRRGALALADLDRIAPCRLLRSVVQARGRAHP